MYTYPQAAHSAYLLTKVGELLLLHVRITYYNAGNVPYTCRCLVTRQLFVHFARFSVLSANDWQSNSGTKMTTKGPGLILRPAENRYKGDGKMYIPAWISDATL